MADQQQAAFESFIQSGGGYVGVHSAADTEYDWPWYGELLGGNAWFLSHPAQQQATLIVDDPTHESTAHYDPVFDLFEEWYAFRANARPFVNVLITIDESTYTPRDKMGTDHPIAWYHEFDGGRAWYTAMGHRSETYGDAAFRNHLRGGISWAAGLDSQLGVCGDGNRDGTLTASDALTALSAAVGASTCANCVCDVDGSGSKTASDALAILQAAVGSGVLAGCGGCVCW